MSENFNITKTEMLEALNKSGYLLESEISKSLAIAGFFIEPNQIIEDPITGKSREIDLIAEYYEYKKEWAKFKCHSKVKFVIEIKNNLFPIVLITRFEFSPNIEDWIGLKEVLTVPENIDYNWNEGYYDRIIQNSNALIYTQYCSFQKKRANDELMALHPSNIYEGLSKITHYCEESIRFRDNDLLFKNPEDIFEIDEYLRHLLFLPILLINEELYELRDDKLIKVESSILVYNYLYNKEPKMAYVFVVTKNGFKEFINKMLKLEDNVGNKMVKIRKSIVK